MKIFLLTLVLALFTLPTFAHEHRNPTSSFGGADRLSQAEALTRGQQVKRVDYDLKFQFTEKATSFTGQTTIRAELAHTDLPLFVDAYLEQIKSIRVNKIALNDFTWANGKIEIPARHLAPLVEIEIDYAAKFSPGTDGIFRVVDPVDNAEYIYTNLEPFGAHHVFPCFDQPDLKATYQVTVTAPKAWATIGNTPVAFREESAHAQTARFAPTLRFSTYLFFLGAGGYQAWHSEHKGLPLTIYARASLAPHVDAENIFALTKTGLDFFQSYFDSPYPFPKYDHVFTPELGNGAMENPGAVTMNERMIYQGGANDYQRFQRGNTLLHEMAHMWFGDLVTMRWWNDLWLNESFATYMAALALDRAAGFGEIAWQDFTGDKGWAYWQDQMVTTHPIVVPVRDTDETDTIFDGITYAKGASSLKQLHFFVGEEGFREGVRAYFKKHAWKNTEMKDFMNEIAAASGLNLNEWTSGWLQTAGLNRIEPKWACENGRVTSFSMHQSATVAGRFLPHKTKIGFFRRSVDGLELSETLEAKFEGPATEIFSAHGLACPDFVYGNMSDEDYGLYAIDPQSLSALGRKVNQFTSPSMRQMIWAALAQMTMDQKLRTSEYLEMSITGLASEENLGVLAAQITNYGSVREALPFLHPRHRDLPARVEAAAWAEVNEARENIALRLLWVDHYLAIVTTPAGTQNLKSLLAGGKLTQEQRWAAIKRLSSLGDADALALARAELNRDRSNSGQNDAFAARLNFPDLANKENFWRELTDFSNNLTYFQRTNYSQGFHSASRPELSLPFVDRYFALLRGMDWEAHGYLSELFFQSLFPKNLCSTELLERSRAELNALTLPMGPRNAWLEANEMLEKCVKNRDFDR